MNSNFMVGPWPSGSGARRRPGRRVAAAGAVLLLVAGLVAGAAAQDTPWLVGRATYYGGPAYYTKVFDATRGNGSFGILEQGSCGFTNSNGALPFPKDAVAAAADANFDYAGSCGRCYAVRCRSGYVLDNDGKTLNINAKDFTYLPTMPGAAGLKDEQGRGWPGNQGEGAGMLQTKCWDDNKEVRVRIIDSCPCRQVLPDGAPGVKAGGEFRRQGPCCPGTAGISHFDLSFWAFTQLAHPLYGQQMLQYRPVDCDTGAPLPQRFIDRGTIYKNGARPGWGWRVYFGSYFDHAVKGAAPGGGSATCADLTKQGGLTFLVKQAAAAGLAPFGGAKELTFLLRDGVSTSPPQEGKFPDLKIFLMNDGAKKYCNKEVYIKDLFATSVAVGGGWRKYTAPFAAFKCDYAGARPNEIDRVDFQNYVPREKVPFCLADMVIVR